VSFLIARVHSTGIPFKLEVTEVFGWAAVVESWVHALPKSGLYQGTRKVRCCPESLPRREITGEKPPRGQFRGPIREYVALDRRTSGVRGVVQPSAMVPSDIL
jgi:hypothetical protein